MKPTIAAFFDEATNTITYVVADPATRSAAIIDSVLDFDPASGRTSKKSADRVIEHVRQNGLMIEWVLETHVHADHLTAAPYLKEKLGGRIAMGEHIREVQVIFKGVFNAESAFVTDGSQFDHLFVDGERFSIGSLEAQAIHTPGHTPADMTYLVGDAAFVGDTLFMPDYGTARADFPGGDAVTLYRSIRRILSLPEHTRLFTAHDYKPEGRDYHAWESTVAEQRAKNIHVHHGVSEEAFVTFRTARDATLGMPRLILPSIQVNMRAGSLPQPEANGVSYLKLPVNAL
jgi:glyoxylase-like metal-dependent hydrolase (beta-lactamase superfamily II)